MDAAVYARYSTDNQNENSIETQIALCREFAQKRGMNVVSVYKDEAKSGMKMTRNGFQNLIYEIENHSFHAVIIYDQSRLSRDLVDWFLLRKMISSHGIELFSVLKGEFGDLSDPAVFLSESVEAVFNQLHVLTTRKKTAEGMRNMAANGKFTGGRACLGYDIIDQKYIINEAEAETVRLLFDMYSKKKSYSEIIEKLNSYGATTKAGLPFGTNSLSTILRNEKYIGTYVYGRVKRRPDGSRNSHESASDAIRIEGAIPAIIDREVWSLVQNRMSDRKQNPRNTAKVEYLLSGKIFCGECGSAMTGETSNKRYYYYSCSSKKRLKNCNKTAVNKENVEIGVINAVKEFLEHETVDSIAEKLYRSMEGIGDTVPKLKRSIRKEIELTSKKIENINAAITDGIWSKSTAITLTDLEKKIDDLNSELENLDGTAQATEKTLDDVKNQLNIMLDASKSENHKFIIDLCVEKVVCFDDGTTEIVINPLGIDTKPKSLTTTWNGKQIEKEILTNRCSRQRHHDHLTKKMHTRKTR